MAFEYYCRDCANRETLEVYDENWLCICKQRPEGMSTLHVCSECNNHRWGLRNSTECERCFAKKLSDRQEISIEPFGDAVNMKRRDKKLEAELFEKNWERFEEAKRQKILNKIAEQKAILSLPKLLGEIRDKLDGNDETEYDENGHVIFSSGDKFDI